MPNIESGTVTDNHLAKAREIGARIIANIATVIVGKDEALQLGAAALLSRGHILIEGVPGVGKTIYARSMAKSIGVSFKRIQCTADLLPSDITGVYIFDQRDREFSFRPGPVMAHIVLVDEINRASPKTQSALLECMEERQITIEGVTHPMPDPFVVLATRNPTEHGGTFPYLKRSWTASSSGSSSTTRLPTRNYPYWNGSSRSTL